MFPRDAALEAVSSRDRTTLGRYTACGLQARSHPQTDLMASRAVVYSAPRTVVEQQGWYTTTELFSTASASRNDVTATCGSCGTLDIRTRPGPSTHRRPGQGQLAAEGRLPTHCTHAAPRTAWKTRAALAQPIGAMGLCRLRHVV